MGKSIGASSDRSLSSITVFHGKLQDFRYYVRCLFERMIEALFPSNIYCLVCNSLIDETRPYALCDRCVQEFHWITGGSQADGSVQRVCAKCGKALPASFHGYPAEEPEEGILCYDCMMREHYFEKGFSCLTYGKHERELMMALKYSGKSYIARKMGDILYDRMVLEKDQLGIDCIIPVPVSTERLRTRGYNQSELMAARMAELWREEDRLAPPCRGDILIRARQTQMLRSLNPAERRLAMDGAFEVKSDRLAELQGETVLLVDDIYTTGATADECSRTLLAAGASKVYLLSLASGGNRKPADLKDLR